jgi:hypothetical protein
MGRRLSGGLALGILLSLSVPAIADEPPDPPKVAAKPEPDRGRSPITRPAVVGLIAALFLIVGAAAGKNDKPG